MHEMSTCRSLIKQVEKTAQDYVGFKITNIEVSIGQLSNINIHELKELFPLASVNTIAENAKLTIIYVTPDIHCLDCNKDSVINNATNLDDNINLTCPLCKSKNTIPLNGTDMLLTNIEIESDC